MNFGENKISRVVVIIRDPADSMVNEFIKTVRKTNCTVILKNIEDKNITYNRQEQEQLYQAEKVRIYLFGTVHKQIKFCIVTKLGELFTYYDIINDTLQAIHNKEEKNIRILTYFKENKESFSVRHHNVLNWVFLMYSSQNRFFKTDGEYIAKMKELISNYNKSNTTPCTKNNDEPIYEDIDMTDAGSINCNDSIMNVVIKSENKDNCTYPERGRNNYQMYRNPEINNQPPFRYPSKRDSSQWNPNNCGRPSGGRSRKIYAPCDHLDESDYVEIYPPTKRLKVM